MLLHLLYYLMKKQKATPASPTRHREIPDGEIVIECPKCGVTALSPRFLVDESDRSGIWKRVNEVYQCASCKSILQEEDMENDGRGVMRVRTWTCTACQTKNSALSFRCQKCAEWCA